MDVLVLQGAIVALVGFITALAKVAWSERGARLAECDKKITYYEQQVIPTMHRVLDASEKQQTGLAVLTRVVEDGIKEIGTSG